MNKRIFALISLVILILAAVGIIKNCKKCDGEAETAPAPDRSSVEYNVQRATELLENMFLFVAYVEDDKGCKETGTYFCGARWTAAYGVTVKPDGSLVRKGEKVSRAQAKEWAMHHLRKQVVPFLSHADGVKLSDEKLYMIMLVIYNMGGELVTGYDRFGNKQGEPAAFFVALNEGKPVEEVANLLTRYRKSAGKRAPGLLKRHWVEGAIGLGIITPENVLNLRPVQFYETKNFGNYYWLTKKRDLVEKKGLYQLRYDELIINTFFNMNEARNGQKSVRDILP